MHQCPHCRSTERQVKSGFNRTGTQRLQCQSCRRQYTPEPNPLGYDEKTREAALKLYLEGNGLRRIGRLHLREELDNRQAVADSAVYLALIRESGNTCFPRAFQGSRSFSLAERVLRQANRPRLER